MIVDIIYVNLEFFMSYLNVELIGSENSFKKYRIVSGKTMNVNNCDFNL